MLALARSRPDGGQRYDVRLPYGPMDWTVLALHGFRDSWLHERDILSGLPASTLAALSRMALCFHTPVTPSPA
jgi:hypothetical protein